MWKKWAFALLIIGFLSGNTTVLASSVSIEEVYNQSKTIENQIDKGEDLLLIKQKIDHLAELYSQLDLSETKQTVEGIQVVSSELIGLKMQFAAIHAPDMRTARDRSHRLTIGFESLAYPKTAKWKTMAKDILHDTDQMLNELANKNMLNVYKEQRLILQKQKEIGIALELNGTSDQVNLLRSVSSLWEQEATKEQIDSLRVSTIYYRDTLDKMIQEPITVGKEFQSRKSYNDLSSWGIAVGLLLVSGFLIFRRVKTRY